VSRGGALSPGFETTDRLNRDKTESQRMRAELPPSPWAWATSDPPQKADGSAGVHYTTAQLQQHRNRRWAKPWLASIAPADRFAAKLFDGALSDARPVVGSMLRSKNATEGKAAILRLLEEKGALEALAEVVYDGALTLLQEQEHEAERAALLEKVGIPSPQPFNGSHVPRSYMYGARARTAKAISGEGSLAVPSTTSALKKKLAGNLRGLRRHFEQADEDGSGTVDKFEFRAAVRAMGVVASDERCDAAFLELDFDRSGTISYDEYVRFALREALSASFGKVVDLFRKWDADGDGHVSKAELQRACDEIGFDAPTEDLDALFEQFDADGSGKVSYQEMHKLLRQGGAMQLSPSLRPGAVRMATDASTAHFHGGRPGDASAARVRGRGSKNIANEFAGYPEELHRESLRGTSPRNLRWRPDTRRPPNSPMAAVRISVLGAVGNAHREAGGPLVRVQIAF
jgi:Ca2+-binding EF-hand superfamily protein